MGAAEAQAATRASLPAPRFEGRTVVRVAVIVGLLAFVLFAVPSFASNYWIQVLTLVAVYSIVALGLNLLMGRVGLVSLGQIAVLALGAWVAARLFFATGLPFPACSCSPD